MAICTYYQQGRCKFGDRCAYEHPKNQGQFGFTTGNRFGVLQSGGNKPGSGFGGDKQDPREKYSLTAADIKNDLTDGQGRPQWIFSAYGPGRNAPVQLFGGPEREQSFEEMRALHYAAVAEGKPQEAIQNANNLFAATEAQMKNIISNLDAAIQYVIDGENQHPNRHDIVNGKITAISSSNTQPNPFPQQSQSQNPVQPSPFGGSNPSQQSGGLGSTFGKPTMLGQQQPQQPAFGTPSFGTPSLGAPAFGAPSFGQPSAMGSSPFGQVAASAKQQQSNPFGKPAASPFSQAAQTTNPFGQPQAQAAQAQQSSPFAQLQSSTQPQPGFGTNPFGSGTSLNQQQSTPAPFGQPSSFKGPATSVQPQASAVNVPPPSGPILPVKNANPNLNPLPKTSGQTVQDPMTKKLTVWKGLRVQYIDDEPCYQHPDDPQFYAHIFFPDGPPKPDTFKYSAASPEGYTSAVEEAYKFAHENGAFKDGVMPSVPPKPEWSRYDI
ncbi:hypothetical protein TESG_01971 [Trichophyton tonsurans CBS 112818]|uniref:CCCH zinc finger domain-containing protein n=2 Tax=Trichophyton TaxID=5550 RepID=F2PL41_TRIEC|nr:hypothetical protein TESG_01971 [Trichophyton tonsurans CBS 112818]EGE02639.1 CCCH zinc finger domain-containing protein [Trichophyton equinum CBS 127.97]